MDRARTRLRTDCIIPLLQLVHIYLHRLAHTDYMLYLIGGKQVVLYHRFQIVVLDGPYMTSHRPLTGRGEMGSQTAIPWSDMAVLVVPVFPR